MFSSTIALLLTAVLSALPESANGQMESPLKGQGIPSLNTTEVYVSVRLERLLEVDDAKFRHDNVASFWLTWRAPGAAAAIAQRTEQVRAAGPDGAGCRRPCTNKVADERCCDTLFLPSFYFSNAFAFPEDREIGYTIDTVPDGAVIWEATIHAVYFQPMQLSVFPYDQFFLEMQLTLVDTSSQLPGHPGLLAVPSASAVDGVNFAKARQDLVNGWDVVRSETLEAYRVNRSAWYQPRMMSAAHPADPAPFYALNASSAGQLDDTSQVVVFRFPAARYYWGVAFTTLYPVYAVAFFSLVVFFLPLDDIGARIEVIAALFLTLVAIKFVTADIAVARQNYFDPMQNLILITGIYLMVIGFLSVVIFHIAKWRQHRKSWKEMKEAWKERCRQREAASAAAARAAAGDGTASQDGEVTKASSTDSGTSAASAGATCMGAGSRRCLRLPHSWRSRRQKMQLSSALPPPPDPYLRFIAFHVNWVSFVLVLITYVIAALVIMLPNMLYGEDIFVSAAAIAGGAVPGLQVA